jgi:sugar O-acyltransferase (sialic acid O-acetyltransferase NeuD family)
MAKVVIFGITDAGILCHFFLEHDSPHDVVAFTVDREYMQEESFRGLPLVPFEDVENIYPPSEYQMYIAMLFHKGNRTRAEKCFQAEAKGYDLISYVSSKAITWPGLVLGKNCFISEGSIINPFVEIGNNVTVAGGFVGHHSIVKDHCFLAAHSVILGCSVIEPYCFIGANSTITHCVHVARECIIGSGVSISRNTKEKGVYVGKPPELLPKPSDQLSQWLTWQVR